MSRIPVLGFTCFSLATLYAGAGLACSCIGVAPSGCQIPEGRLVFRAKVTWIDLRSPRPPLVRGAAEPWGVTRVGVKVLERFRGEPNDASVVYTEASGESCGYPFETGTEYLIFAEESDRRLLVTSCSGTQRATAAVARIRQLRSERDKTPLPDLYGSVLPEGSAVKDVDRAGPVAVIAERDGREFRVEPRDGLYEFTGLTKGEYLVHVAVPDGYTALWTGGVEALHAPAGFSPSCAVNFRVFKKDEDPRQNHTPTTP